MVEIVLGGLGKGKTRTLIGKANDAIQVAKGSIVYLDNSTKHMYELSNQIRLINVSEYPVRGYDAFIGFVSGIISQDHDLEQIYCDKFLDMAGAKDPEVLVKAVKTLEAISRKFDVSFTVGVMDYGNFPEELKDHLIVTL